ncbi:MAG: hypothetical protein JSU74_04215 [Candidatus Zixiibacteriota bacterium]|nr:MAG: hypothetical protein JSU74_04215 [candidate division Zixibacteria bacterium]
MNGAVSLREAERKVFLTATGDGLTDVFVGSIFLMMVIAPFLSESMGDWWSAAVFVPFWGLLMLAIWLIRKHVVRPRIGEVKFGIARKMRLRKFGVIMLVANIVAFILGIWASASVGAVSGYATSVLFGMMCLLFFSIAAYFLDTRRFFFYGLMAGASPLVGEWLWQNQKASHHGFPITFGVTSGVIILTGLVLFIRLVRNNPVPTEDAAAGES